MSKALITGGTRGFGLALAGELGHRGWETIITGRDVRRLELVAAEIGSRIVAGDITSAEHRRELVAAVGPELDLLVNNAGTLGPSPLPRLAAANAGDIRRALDVNLVAPLILAGALLPALEAAGGVLVNVTSDAAVEPYPGWGIYGATKAGLELATAVLSEESPGLSIYAFDPGDMRTAMHQAAFPEEDISDRPVPETVAPLLLRLVEARPPSGRYSASQVSAEAA